MAGGVTGWAVTCDNIGPMTSEPRGYSNNHRRVYRERGPARDYSCFRSCGRQATQWAHLHDTDTTDPDNYISLCRSCHAKYDGAVPPLRTGVKPANSGFTDEQAEEMRRLVGAGVSQADVARRYSTHRQLVWRIVHGIAYNRGGG